MPATKPYHHGNLKSTLLDASFVLIQEHGIERFSLRQLAGKTGVSHTAAYRHFQGKDHLIASIAASIYKRIADRIQYYSLKGLLPTEQVVLGATAVVRFALDRPEEFRLLTQLGSVQPPEGNLAVEALTQLFASASAPDPAARASLLWAALHGLSDLAVRKQPGYSNRKQVLAQAENLAKSIV